MHSNLGNAVLLTLVAVSIAACGHASANPPAAIKAPAPVQLIPAAEPARVAGEYLVTLVAGADAKVISEVYGRFRVKSVKAVGQGIFQLILSEDPGPTKMEEVRKLDARIKAVQPNYIYRAN